MSSSLMTCRMFVAGASGASALFLAAPLLGKEVMKDIKDLKPGEFTWHP